jgi:hypothetical protein
MLKGIFTITVFFILLHPGYAQQEEETSDSSESFIPVITLDQLDEDEDEGTTSGVLSASRDAFESAITFTLGRYRYRFRGYDGRYNDFQLNYMPVNDMILGWFSYSNLGGLSNVLYGRNNSIGLETNNQGTGGIGGMQAIDIRAGNQRRNFRGTYSFTNGSYSHRLMATYNTGITEKNWAISMSVNRRWAQEGYIDGSFYDSYGYYFGVEKFIGERHRLALSVISNASRRGRSSGTTQEVYDLAGSNYYNSYWGYQEGEKRNARVSTMHQPLFFLNYEWNKPEKIIWRSVFFSQFGRNGTTALDWYDGKDPRPDYYRNLPSYYDDPAVAADVEAAILNNPLLLQLDWDYMYQANYTSSETVEDADGIEGNDVTGRLARYLVEERRFDNMRFGHASSFEWNAADRITMHGGISWERQVTSYYKLLDDLLGAEFHVDVNKFAERDFPESEDAAQNDLNNPNRIIREGDVFGYDYDAVVCETGGWLQSLFTFDKLDFSVAAGLSNNRIFREGLVRNGIFPENSFGKSEKKHFIQYNFKTNLTYKITGKHFLYATAVYENKAPTFRDAFISPRTRNDYVPDVKTEKIISMEGGYLMKSPDFKARAVFYYTAFRDKISNINFYNDDLNSFVNYSISGIDTRHLGLELMGEVKIIPGLYASVVGVLGHHIYTDRMQATVTQDNNAEVLVENEIVYADNYYLGTYQQNAATFGLDYRSPKFWRIGVDVNYLDGAWISINPARRTEPAVELVEEGSDQWNNILDQEKTDNAVTLDLNGGYSWKMNNTVNGMKKSWFMYLNIGLSNVLNKKDIKTGGYEQYRYDFENRDPDTFPRRYYYAYGFTAYVNLSFRL